MATKLSQQASDLGPATRVGSGSTRLFGQPSPLGTPCELVDALRRALLDTPFSRLRAWTYFGYPRHVDSALPPGTPEHAPSAPPLACGRRSTSEGAFRQARSRGQFTALRFFTLDGTDHADHKQQGSMIRRYIIWRNHHADDRRLRTVVDRANVA